MIIMQNLYISIVNRINTKQTMEIGIPNVNMTVGSNVLGYNIISYIRIPISIDRLFSLYTAGSLLLILMYFMLCISARSTLGLSL